MASQPLVFLGASACFKEMNLIISDMNSAHQTFDLQCILDDDPSVLGTEINGTRVIGPLEMAGDFSDCKFVLGIGSYETRLSRHKIIEKTGLAHEQFATLIHPSAIVYPSARLSHGCILYPHVTVCDDVTVDSFVTMTFNALLAPKVKVDAYAMMTSNTAVLAGAHIGKAAFIGTSSVIGEGLKVGAGAVVVYGSAVFKNVEPGAFVQGNPARYLYSKEVPTELVEE